MRAEIEREAGEAAAAVEQLSDDGVRHALRRLWGLPDAVSVPMDRTATMRI